MYLLTNWKTPLGVDFSRLNEALAQALHIAPQAVSGAVLVKKSVDARDKSDVHFVLSVRFDTRVSTFALRVPRGATLAEWTETPHDAPPTHTHLAKRPLVVGLGPAGLFAALALARAGAEPVVVERGRDVDSRARSVAAFFRDGRLDPQSNIQFGEGGAGAFSDGKLNTGISDARCRLVLETLYAFGAPEEILYQAKPHIGTDKLPGVVKRIREEIVRLGGTVRFETQMTRLALSDGRVVGAWLRDADGSEWALDTDRVLLAVGHSARDTFETLFAQGVPMQPKPFSLGVRIEHAQSMIDRAQYGAFAGHPALGAADYKLAVRTPAGRGVYTFCMCPGGQVVAAASEADGVVTNGMSRFARDGQNANAAVLASVDPSDYGDGHPLSGVRFQQTYERLAFRLGGGGHRAPAQRVGDFLAGRASTGAGDVAPSYLPGVVYADLAECLPPFVTQALRAGLGLMDRRLRGFASPGAVLTGVETRSSAPLRILRGSDGYSATDGLIPCGEGAGYAGGILSAAVDGLRCADALLNRGASHE